MQRLFYSVLFLFLFSASLANFVEASMEVVAGRVSEKDGLKITVEQRNGRYKTVKLTEKTPVVAIKGATAPPIDRIMIQSKVSIIIKDGKPVVVQIIEVPK
jgi:hypothetical protein